MRLRRRGAWLSIVGLALLVLAAGLVLSAHRSMVPRAKLVPAPDWKVTAATDRVIFDRETARKIWPWPEGDQTDFWTPATADVLALEEQLPSYLRRELARVPPDLRPHPDNPPLWQKALSYHRQYAGVLNHRRQVIAGNFFCSDVQRDWHKELVEVVGGGDCFFGIKYDVEDRRIFDLWINADK
jgi:hypothetical protein